jgi:2,3,4,5-tetrahydropyridine-2-carboxylate N-succinyltransferase
MKELIEAAWEDRAMLQNPEIIKAIEAVIDKLDKGLLRVAEPCDDGNWIINDWVKKAVVLYFPIRQMEVFEVGPLEFYDKMALKSDYKVQVVRVVP